MDFSDSSYLGQSVRYHNLDMTDKLSMDYAIYKGDVYFATSEQALRAVLDYASQQ
jgi:hypothetical protein